METLHIGLQRFKGSKGFYSILCVFIYFSFGSHGITNELPSPSLSAGGRPLGSHSSVVGEFWCWARALGSLGCPGRLWSVEFNGWLLKMAIYSEFSH